MDEGAAVPANVLWRHGRAVDGMKMKQKEGKMTVDKSFDTKTHFCMGVIHSLP